MPKRSRQRDPARRDEYRQFKATRSARAYPTSAPQTWDSGWSTSPSRPMDGQMPLPLWGPNARERHALFLPCPLGVDEVCLPRLSADLPSSRQCGWTGKWIRPHPWWVDRHPGFDSVGYAANRLVN